MPVEIIGKIEKTLLIAPKQGLRQRLKPTPPGIVPQGFDAVVQVNGIEYKIRDFTERTGHTAGAQVVGDGVVLKLDEQTHINAINLVIFKWVKKLLQV
jgi:hypothetical protein